MAEPQFPITCGHCNASFWSYNVSATRVCNDCFSHGHRGNGGDCWACKDADLARVQMEAHNQHHE